MQFSIEKTARDYVYKRFPRASIPEKEKIINDWAHKERDAQSLVGDFKKRIGEVKDKKILDAGCGNGGLSTAFSLAGAEVHGVEIEKDLYEISQQYAENFKTSPKFYLYDAGRLPFEDNFFDFAVSASVLEHTDDPAFYLSEILRVLKPGGSLYLGFPNKFAPRETHTKLLFLTYLPNFLKHWYVRTLHRNPLPENNLHFYGYFDLKRMIKKSSSNYRFRILEEEGESKNIFKKIIKRILNFFGIPYKALLPHILVILKKEAITPRIALMSYAMDNRMAKGIALYTRKLITGLLENDKNNDDNKYYLVHYDKVEDPLYQKAEEILMPKVRLPYGSRFISQLLFFWKYRKEPFDAVHWFHPRLYPLYSFVPAKKIIVTVHGAGDITAINKFVFSRSVFNYVLKYFHRSLDTIIVVSKFAKTEVVEYYGFRKEKVVTIYNGGGEDLKPLDKEEARKQMLSKYGVEGPYILDVSRFLPHKNVTSLINAYQILRKNNKNISHKLVIVGGQMYMDRQDEYEARDKSDFRGDIIFIEFVPGEDLNYVYSGADLFVFPSLNEGFGIPVVEAMASGTPVITSNVTSMPEIGGEAVIIVDPLDVETLAVAMKNILMDVELQEEMVRLGLSRAKEFTWGKMVEETRKLYE